MRKLYKFMYNSYMILLCTSYVTLATYGSVRKSRPFISFDYSRLYSFSFWVMNYNMENDKHEEESHPL